MMKNENYLYRQQNVKYYELQTRYQSDVHLLRFHDFLYSGCEVCFVIFVFQFPVC